MKTAYAKVLAASLAGVLGWPVALLGQARDTVRAAQDTVVPVYNLEKIEVTVTRIRSLVNRTPYALHVVDRSVVQAAEPTVGLEESLGEVAGVWVNNRNNFALGSRISIRGFGSRAQFGVRGVKLLLDGIPLTLPDGQSQQNNIDLATIGRVEVIRGPASSLYGNAAGGVISFKTEEPAPAAAEPDLRVLWGTFGDGRDFQKYVGKVGGRQGRFDYVASVSHFRTDGFREWSEAQTTVVNARARWYLDGATQLSAVLNLANTPIARNPGSLPLDTAETRPEAAWPFNIRRQTGEKARQAQGGLSLERRLSRSQELRVSAWGVTRELDNPIPPRIIDLSRRGGGARVETEFTPLGSLLSSVVAGVELELQSDERVEYGNADGSRGAKILEQDESVRGLAAFTQGAIPLADRWELTVGARYDAVRFKVKDRFLADTTTPGDPADDSGERTLRAFSPMVGLRHTPLPWLNVYANVARAFETPTTVEFKNRPDGVGGFNLDLKPQNAWGVELGFKGTVSERLDYGLANFCAFVEDELIPVELQPGSSYFRNAGKARHCGIEAQAGWLLAEGLTLSANYTFSDFKFTDYVAGSDTLDGNRLPGIPVHQAHVRVFYRSPVDLFGSLEATYSDRYFTDDLNTARNADYTIFDLRVGYSGRFGAWALEPFVGVNNLFDTRYNSSTVINATGRRFYEPGPGRTYYSGLRVPVQIGR